MNFNLVEMYNGLLRFNKHILNGQDTDKAVRVPLLGGYDIYVSAAGSGFFDSHWVRSDSRAHVGFFTTVKLD